MAKRDYISEILSKRKRLLKKGDRWAQFTKRYNSIQRVLKLLDREVKGKTRVKDEALKYIPIGLVACMEGYLRMAFRDLINHGSPYQDNAAALSDIKYDIKTVIEINRKTVTLGEFVAHLIPINNLSDINKYMSILLGEDFLRILNTEKVVVSKKPPPLDKLVPNIYQNIEEVFRQRHIYCHELATKHRTNIKEQWKFLGAVVMFIFATEILLKRILV